MPIINKGLSQLITQKFSPPVSQQKSEQQQWLSAWADFCVEALSQGSLRKVYQRILEQKVKDASDELIRLSFQTAFFTELLLTCNLQFNWFEQDALNRDFIEQSLRQALNQSELEDENRIILKEYYQSFCSDWIHQCLAAEQNTSDSIQQRRFNVFWTLYNNGFFPEQECQTHIKTYLNENQASCSEGLHLVQDNFLVISRYFDDFLSKNKLNQEGPLPSSSNTNGGKSDDDSRVLENLTSSRLNIHRKTNQIFNRALHSFLTNRQQQLKPSSLVLNFSSEQNLLANKNLLKQLIAMGQFTSIQLADKNTTYFSYTADRGILINQGCLDFSEAEEIELFSMLLHWENAILPQGLNWSRYDQFNASNIERRLYQLAIRVIDSSRDEFSLDEQVPFSQFGQHGLRVYLNRLSQDFVRKLESNQIERGYTLYLPKKNHHHDFTRFKLKAIQGINDFLRAELGKSETYVFCCQRIELCLQFSIDDRALISEFLQLVDQAKLKQLILILPDLKPELVDALVETLSKLSYTQIRFAGQLAIEQALYLEAINDTVLQQKVTFISHGAQASTNLKQDISQQPAPFTRAKIQALLAKTIELKPVESKISFQNQHHYQQENQQQNEVQIAQSWQIEQANQVSQQHKMRTGFLFGDESRSLIGWQDIEPAFNPRHPQHEASRSKLGEELLHYHYKGRNLVDLWQRLTGDIKLTKQQLVSDSRDSLAYQLHFFSPLIPKQISHKALLIIAGHPHLFQDGLHLDALPEYFAFSSSEGALYIDPSKTADPCPFTLRILPPSKTNSPAATYFQILKNSALAGQLFFQLLQQQVSAYQAWHYWLRCFSALNRFNPRGIQAIYDLAFFQQDSQQEPNAHLDYFINAIDYYHHAKLFRMQDEILPERNVFENEQQKKYMRGEADALAPYLLQDLSLGLRELLHRGLADLFNTSALTELSDNQLAHRQVFFSALAAHHECLDKTLGINWQIASEDWIPILDIMGEPNSIKLMEFVLSQDGSLVYNLLSSLQAIYAVWGAIGLNDFNTIFLTPAANFAPLAQTENQQALQQLLQLSAPEYHWWQQLSEQHGKQSGFAEPAPLMAAFQQFLTELESLGLANSLYMPCPLQGVSNLQVGLNRVLSLLKLAKKPTEQWLNLAGLDWHVDGVLYAAQDLGYDFVSADMQLNLAFESKLSQIVSQNHGSILDRKFYHHKVQPFHYGSHSKLPAYEVQQQVFELTLGCFYRYLGASKYVAPMQVYQQFLDVLDLPQNFLLVDDSMGIEFIDGRLVKKLTPRTDFRPLILSNLLQLLAYATTGSRGLDRLPRLQQQRVDQLRQLIQIIFATASKRASIPELDSFYRDSHAVSYQEVLSIIKHCADLYFYSHYSEGIIELDLAELRDILNLVNHSIESYHQLQLNEHKFHYHQNKDSAEPEQWSSPPVWGRIDNQLLFTGEFLNKFQHYFMAAVNRMTCAIAQSDYASFLMVCKNIAKQEFSYENKGRLIRLMGLVNFTMEDPLIASQVGRLFGQLQLIERLYGSAALNSLLLSLSTTRPLNNRIKLKQLETFVDAWLKLDAKTEITTLLQEHFGSYQIDHGEEDLNDPEFYPGPEDLELSFPGLGQFYSLIKRVLLQRFPVSFGDNKRTAWQEFLHLIQQVSAVALQVQVLQTLSESAQQNIDLYTLNSWLVVLLKQEKYRQPFHPELFRVLASQLLKHPEKQAFIKVLDYWLSYNFSKGKLGDHHGFLQLLNQLATMPQGLLCLENLYKASRSVYSLAHEQDYPWYKNFETLLQLHSDLSIEQLNELLAVIALIFDKAGELKPSNKQLNQALLFWLANIDQRVELTLELAQDMKEELSSKAQDKILILAQLPAQNLKNVSNFLNQIAPSALAQLASCYQLAPLPKPQLMQRLMRGELTIETFLAQHRADPHSQRTSGKLAQQFNNELLWPYLKRAKYLGREEESLLDFHQRLYGQLKFINHLGYEEIRHLSLSEIRQALADCQAAMALCPDQTESLVIQLRALSLIREAIYKMSSSNAIIWPSAVQMLAILSRLNHQANSTASTRLEPLFLQLATGEGKSLIAINLAILDWLKYQSVTIVTHRASLALRDAQAYKPLLDSLGINSRQLTADRYRLDALLHQLLEKDKPEFAGIFFAEFNDLILIRQQRLLDRGQDIEGMAFIIDEADEIILHSQTENNLTQTMGGDLYHPHAWVFESLAAFLEQISPQQRTTCYRGSVRGLVAYLCLVSPLAARLSQQAEFLTKLPIYLEAVWQAQTLNNRQDFVCKEKAELAGEYYAAVLINGKPMPPNVTFNGLVQQGLHGLLNFQSKKIQSTIYYPIAAESILYSTMNPEAALLWMTQAGTVTALSATLGMNELKEIEQNYGFRAIKLPKMQSSLRVDYPEIFAENKAKQFLAIYEICKRHIGNRTQGKSKSIVVFTESIDFTEELGHYLAGKNKEFRPRILHGGSADLSDQTLSNLEIETGRANHLFIVIGDLVLRGFDSKLSSASQLLGINTYLSNNEDEIQLKGRAGRVNARKGSRDKGRSYAVYDLEKECHRYTEIVADIGDLYINPEGFKQRQYFNYYRRESATRLHRQLAGVVKMTIQDHFLSLWKACFKNSDIFKSLRDELMTVFTDALEKIASLVPQNDFSVPTNAGRQAREHYNQTILAQYQETLSQFQAILGERLVFEIEPLMQQLFHRVETQQMLLMQHHQSALARGADAPSVKIYRQWKQGVNYNAYLESGRQGVGNYVYGLVNSFWLSAEDKEQLAQGKEVLAQKVSYKRRKLTNFMSQLELLMQNIGSGTILFKHLLTSYQQQFPESLSSANLESNGQQSAKEELITVARRCTKEGELLFIHEPMLEKAFQIQLISSAVAYFSQLQEAIDQAYKACQLKLPLVFQIRASDRVELGLYKLTIDLSGHQFNSINREHFLTMVADAMNLDLQNLFDQSCLPSIHFMKNVLSEIVNLPKAPARIKALNIEQHSTSTRLTYYQRVFAPLLDVVEKNHQYLQPEFCVYADALLKYNAPWLYQDNTGCLCSTYPAISSNLNELMENKAKGQVLTIIQNQIELAKKGSFANTTLVQQQIECWIQLGLALIKSRADTSLPLIFADWKASKTYYGQENITIESLMCKVQSKIGLFGTKNSISMLAACKEINSVIREMQAQNQLKLPREDNLAKESSKDKGIDCLRRERRLVFNRAIAGPVFSQAAEKPQASSSNSGM